jgi:hypothetical protein
MATSDEAVLKATGKDWKDWFSILDKSKLKTHKELAAFIYENHLKNQKSGDWWAQMVTVEYERARGLRAVNQNEFGFNVSVSKTFEGSIKDVEKIWEKILELKEVKKKNLERLPSKTKRPMIRYKAKEGQVVVSFWDKGNGKTSMIVESVKLPKNELVEKERRFWKNIFGEKW